MKKLFVLFFCFCLFSVCAENHSFFGGNFSATFENDAKSYSIGGNYSVIGYYGGFKKLYASVGLVADVSGERDLLNDDLRSLGISGIDIRFFTVPCRFGLPVEHSFNGSLTLLVVPSLACDVHLFRSDFVQRLFIYGSYYTVNYKLSGFGYSLGLALDVGMKHQVNNLLFRYGVDCDLRVLSLYAVDASYSGSIIGSTKYTLTSSIADYTMLTVSPYVAIGFKW